MHASVNGTRIFYQPVGSPANYPLIVLHGGPGFDHTEMHPWLDGLSDTFWLIYVDLRGQGRSERVDPTTLSLSVFSDDVSDLARALDLDGYALLGHSYGSFVALTHAVERKEASHYVISSGTASFSKSDPEIESNLTNFEPEELREQVTQSWAMESSVSTAEEFAKAWTMQLPFHFARTDSEGYRRYMEAEEAAPGRAIYAPEGLAHFAAPGYADELEDELGEIDKATLIITGEHDRTCTPRAAQDIHSRIRGSSLVIIPDAGHMTFIEQPEQYFTAVRRFFEVHPRSRM